MTSKKYIRILVFVSFFLLLAGCSKKDKSVNDSKEYTSNKYGCVLFNRISTRFDGSQILRCLSPRGVSESFITFDPINIDEIITCDVITCDGDYNKFNISYNQNEYVDTVGLSVSNELVFIRNNEDTHSFVEIIDDGKKTVNKIPIPNKYIISEKSEVFVDAYGLIHIANALRQDNEAYKKSYIILKDEEMVFCRDLLNENASCRLIVFPDMTVGLDITDSITNGRINHEIIHYNDKDSACVTVCKYSTNEIIDKDEIVSLNVFDDSHLVYITCKGIYLSDYNMDNPEMIFNWHQNGISFNSSVSSFEECRVCANDQGDIFVLKEGFKCDEYLKLSKLPEKITTVEIAGLDALRSYNKAVFNFNISHPEYHITIRDDYDKTILLTKLISGEGPEVIESGVVDEQSQKNMWEPLGNLVSEDTIANLNKGAIICGSIDGELLGAAPCFAIDTLVTGVCFEKWDYDTFIQSIKTNPNLETITGNSLLEGKLQILRYLFCDGIDDTYFIDHNDQTYTINRDKLEETAFLIEKYQNDENLDKTTFDMVADKSMLCMRFLVFRPIDLYYILYAFNDKGYVTGYPGKNGAKHYLFDSGTLFVRKNISDEKKKVISEFFEYLLSYEGQNSILIDDRYDGFSARDDVLSEQINAMKEREGEMAGLGNVMFLLKDIDTEYAKEEIDKIIEKSIPEQDWDDPFYTIIWEEFDNYFSGNIDMDTLEDHLSKRIEIYINERQ